MGLPSVAQLTSDQRLIAAETIRTLDDITLPELECWNYNPCKNHETVQIDCINCALVPFKHQRVAAAWLYFRKHGLVSYPMGSGKSACAGLLIALLKENKELENKKVLVVCRAPAVKQWQQELLRMMPALKVVTIQGSSGKRLKTYKSNWEVAVIGKEMFLNDYERNALGLFNISTMIVDDVDALRHRDNRTSWAIKGAGLKCERVVLLTGTPLHKKLHEIYSVLEPVGAREILGSETSFLQRYVRTEKVNTFINGKKSTKIVVAGYKHVQELIDNIKPYIIRKTIEELDLSMPEVSVSPVYLELYPAQREKYKDLQKGVLEMVRNGQVSNKERMQAFEKFLRGEQICSGLPSLGEDDGPKASSKLDWLLEQLTEGDLADEYKVVVFIKFKGLIKAAQRRLDLAGIKYVTVWGDENDMDVRSGDIDTFKNDPGCRILLGTTSIEQSINLQVSRHLVMVDMILNPARVAQIIGRVRRVGSKHKTVYIHQLFCKDTQEEFYLGKLEKEQALIDTIFEEDSDIFQSLSPLELLNMITME